MEAPERSGSRRLALAEVLATEQVAAGLLVLAAIAAVAWATINPEGYHHLWNHELLAGFAHGLLASPEGMLANGAMVLFFLAVGLELGREHASGEGGLSRAGLPGLAALGGMLGAALVYLVVVLVGRGHGIASGWPVPTATDVAFSIGALSLVGRAAPASLRPYLLTLAVADDLLAVALLAVVGPHHADLASLGLVVGALALVAVARRRGAGLGLVVLLGGVLFVALANAGIEPILAGAVAGLSVPRRTPTEELSAERLERVVTLASSYLVMPLFILAAAGVPLRAGAVGGAGLTFVAILAARTLGKAGGVAGTTLVAARHHRLVLPEGCGARELWGLGLLCGVGLTVPLLFAGNVFRGQGEQLAAIRLALLAASLLAGVGGIALLRRSPRGRTT